MHGQAISPNLNLTNLRLCKTINKKTFTKNLIEPSGHNIKVYLIANQRIFRSYTKTNYIHKNLKKSRSSDIRRRKNKNKVFHLQ